MLLGGHFYIAANSYSGVDLKDEHEIVSLDTEHAPKRLF